ncbi:MAG: T9SS type A sorting domain-containing protein [Bacteroidota bacterium]
MKKTIVLFISLICILNIAKAQWVRTSLDSIYEVKALAVSGGNIFAGTSWGEYFSTNNGNSWNVVYNSGGGTTAGQSISTLAVEGDTVFAGGEYQSWYTTNYGSNMEVTILTNVLSLAASGSEVLAGTNGQGICIFYNNNFHPLINNSQLSIVNALVIKGNDYFAGNSSGVFMNGAAVNNGLTGAVFSLAINDSSIFAGTLQNGIFLSTNNGSSWTAVNNGLPHNTNGSYPSISAITISGNTIFAGTTGANTGFTVNSGVFMSTNNGNCWTEVNTGLTDTNVLSLAINGDNVFAGTYSGVWKHSISDLISLPVINSTSNDTICSGVAQNYVITSTGTDITYTWSRAAVPGIINAAVSNQTSNHITEVLTNITTLPINVQYLITPILNTCTVGNQFTYTVTVKPLTANASTISGNTLVCKNENITYSVPAIANATSYIWTLPAGSTGSSDSNSIIVNYTDSAVSGNITVYGSSSCNNGTSSTLAITVNPIVANAGIITGITTVCQGQNSVTYNVPAIANATSYIWALPTGATGTSTSDSIIINFGTTATNGNIIVKGHNSCGDGNSSVLSITVNPLPASAGIISGLAKVCQGQNYLTYSIPIIDNATTYIWTLPNGAIGSSDSNSVIVNYDTSYISGIISVKGTNSCGNGNSSNLSVIRHIPDTIPICYVEYDTLTQKNKVFWSSLSSNSTDSIYIYSELTLNSWSKIGSTLYTNKNYLDLTSDPMNQSYSYKISGIDTCNNESVKSSNHKTITLITSYNQLSNTYGFSWSGYEGLAVSQYNVYGVDANGNATVIGTVPGNSLMYNYTNPNLIYVNYFVGFDITPCASKSTHTVRSNYVASVTAGIAENNISQIRVYPNPTKDNLTIETNSNTEQRLEIINLIGQTLYTNSINKKATINISAFANGVYILKLSSDKETVIKKFVKD